MLKNAANSSQSNTDESDDPNFVVREVASASAKDDASLALVAITVWTNESIRRGGKLAECVNAAFQLVFKGQWRKEGPKRHATVTGQLGSGRRLGVRVKLRDDD